MTEAIEATQDAVTAPPKTEQPKIEQPKTEQPKTEQQVLLTEQEVMFATAATAATTATAPAAPARVNPITSRLISALNSVAEAFRPPPPKPIYARRATYLERSCMSREMDRL
jgi:hypothetical protein